MAPFFFFDFTLDKTAMPPVEEIPEQVFQKPVPIPERNNLCPYPIPKIEQIVKDIEKAAYAVNTSKFVSDLFECGAIAISNAVDLAQKDKREKRYLQIIRSYKPDQQKKLAEIFAKVYALLASVVYDDGRFNDNLGELFMRCNLGNKTAGQFFTPYNISILMARCLLDSDRLKEKANNDEIITINDPCCGGGRHAHGGVGGFEKPGCQLRTELLYGGKRRRYPLRTYDLSATLACRRSRCCQTPEHIDEGMLERLVHARLPVTIPAFL